MILSFCTIIPCKLMYMVLFWCRNVETFHSIHAQTSALVSVLTDILNLFSGIFSEPIHRVPHPR